jgi:hypothetical protein
MRQLTAYRMLKGFSLSRVTDFAIALGIICKLILTMPPSRADIMLMSVVMPELGVSFWKVEEA